MRAVETIDGGAAAAPARAARVALRVGAVFLAALGLYLAVGGAWLIGLGGSPYYLAAGTAYLGAAVLLWRYRFIGAWIVAGVFITTVFWAVAEVGFAFWPVFPRLMVPAVVAGIVSLVSAWAFGRRDRSRHAISGTVAMLTAAGLFGGAFVMHGVVSPEPGAPFHLTLQSNAPSDWTAYGRDTAGTRFAPFDQINRNNVANLKVAWTFHTGDRGPGVDSNTPLQVGTMIYSCSPNDHVTAADADSGQVRWQYSSGASSPVWQRCRGLGYYDTGLKSGACAQRIYNTTIDARLIALDAQTGRTCEDFGQKGSVDLMTGQPAAKPGFYMQTSAPTVARGRIIVGGWVEDNQGRGEPSGVIRAYDARTGALDWAWDLGNPATTKLPPAGQTYTVGTPNMWTTAAYDDKLGLVYLPLGNETPDYFGMGRHPESYKYASSLVALDVETGRERWHFQTVHHDIWDYDLPSQPALIDLPDGKGSTVPAVLQETKRGQLFLLNRATGRPVSPVVERPTPQTGQVPEERLSPTQPYSVGLPVLSDAHLDETKAWGMTMLDELACRISFKQLRYAGDFTPTGLKRSLEQPGAAGGLNWGSMSYDPVNKYAYLVDIRIPNVTQLVPAADFPRLAAHFPDQALNGGHGPSPMKGTPYGVIIEQWVSALGVPCSEPPYGTVTALDLKTHRIAWQVPAGTSEDTGPFGIATHLPMPVGMPSYAGTMTTAGGLTFFAGYQDFYIRAYDAQTGHVVWKYRLPVGASATPMSYVSPRTGRQYVVISVGGAAHSSAHGDYVIAFALPQTPTTH